MSFYIQRGSILSSLILLSSMLLPGCATDDIGQKQAIGAFTGGVIGGLIGNQIGSGSRRQVVTTIGAIGGAYIGSEIGRYLDEVDRREQAQATAVALETAHANDTVVWSNPKTGVRGQVTAGPVTYESHPVNMTLLNTTYKATTNADVRAEPSASSPIVSSLRAGETFHAVGKVENANWILVARGRRTIGYVYGNMVKPWVKPAGNKPRPSPTEIQPSSPVEKTVISTKCRTVIRSVTLKSGETAEDKVKFCQQPDGQWLQT
jgi:surface antigen